jgi:hypothetical protein
MVVVVRRMRGRRRRRREEDDDDDDADEFSCVPSADAVARELGLVLDELTAVRPLYDRYLGFVCNTKSCGGGNNRSLVTDPIQRSIRVELTQDNRVCALCGDHKVSLPASSVALEEVAGVLAAIANTALRLPPPHSMQAPAAQVTGCWESG